MKRSFNGVVRDVTREFKRQQDQAVLSVALYPETLAKINFESIDPSDSMKNFVHNMKFSKTNGFSPVDKVQPS